MTSPDVPKAALYSEDAEQAVLGAMLLDAVTAVPAVLPVLTAADFYREAHRRVFDAIVALVQADTAVDPLTLADELLRRGDLQAAGGKDYIGELHYIVPHAHHVMHHAAIVRDRAKRRRVLALAHEMEHAVSDLTVPAEQVLDDVSSRLAPIAASGADRGFQHVKEGVWGVLESLEDAAAGRGAGGRRTGYPEIDEKLQGGFQDGELIVLVGNPKMGKTAMAINLIMNAAIEDGVGAGFVSAEMSRANVYKRMIALVGGIETSKMRSGKGLESEWAQLTRAGVQVSNLPLWVDDTPLPDVDDIILKVRLLKARNPRMRTVVVDFLQLIQAKHERGELQEALLRRIAYKLKGLAKELNLTVIATAQPNDKQVDAREDKRPQLRDIQGSGGIRQAADMIIMLYRPAADNPAAGPGLEFTVAAARDLAPFKVMLEWEGKYARVTSKLRKLAFPNGVLEAPSA